MDGVGREEEEWMTGGNEWEDAIAASCNNNAGCDEVVISGN